MIRFQYQERGREDSRDSSRNFESASTKGNEITSQSVLSFNVNVKIVNPLYGIRVQKADIIELVKFINGKILQIY